MSRRNKLRLAAFLSAFSLSAPAFADSFAIDYDQLQPSAVDASFEADCGAAAADEAVDCAERAAALRAEFVDLLAGLSGESDAETRALFESVSTMNDPQLQAIALRYFTYHRQPPASVWDKAREFFFG